MRIPVGLSVQNRTWYCGGREGSWVEEIRRVTQKEVPTQQLHKRMEVQSGIFCAICRVSVNETVFQLCVYLVHTLVGCYVM